MDGRIDYSEERWVDQFAILGDLPDRTLDNI